ncbi:class I SAM-dependent methyltransferase [Sphingomonas sp. So64.6b]|uniref:class I SAM-dependent methyltransferase n=1 Tax=Sphingomonas sp. So64.6b TaxID=2997354 RepID=UPI0016046E12|nr:class I SAM-dependent methyltransferase [Sphingomonas sp. So64.6b]QNA83350.1 class I SAM-dependent methyltransferase [Sphingomonas sp. So64.6b]
MIDDPSAGWEAIATKFAAIRSDVGTDVVKLWLKQLRPAGTVVDIGCGTGMPISKTLIDEGFEVYGIDPSPTLMAVFRRHFPGAKTVCEAAEVSRFFDRRFDGAVAIGLMFLLPEDSQRAVIEHVGQAIHPGGHFLFSAPRQMCQWNDTLTGRPSLSLGEERYQQLLASAGCRVVDSYVDKGSNYYFHAVSDSV